MEILNPGGRADKSMACSPFAISWGSSVMSEYTERSWASPQKDKLKRQLRILEAARTIIVRSGEAGLTMRAVAAQSNLSLVTPYNLFGSKQAILSAIYEEDYISFLESFDGHVSDTPLARIFDLIDFGIDRYKQTPVFYRTVLALLCRNPGAGVWKPQTAYVTTLISTAVAAGNLRQETPVDLIGSALIRMFRALSQEWLDDLISLDKVRDEIGTSYILLLKGLISDDSRENLARISDRYAITSDDIILGTPSKRNRQHQAVNDR